MVFSGIYRDEVLWWPMSTGSQKKGNEEVFHEE